MRLNSIRKFKSNLATLQEKHQLKISEIESNHRTQI
ncbi:hypothetical protein MJO28_004533 [Puccinia striiformis f. sp. tritici]|uniref:Uncharacterized protein n=1 Tax=Puccinia striiformis f. sp. tritici TaxID=168172 RepID=A0ACC0EP03_9BASI|nr:hypothetical protein MJO28_004533 [Puccinia striiformis f. sp. tritici]